MGSISLQLFLASQMSSIYTEELHPRCRSSFLSAWMREKTTGGRRAQEIKKEKKGRGPHRERQTSSGRSCKEKKKTEAIERRWEDSQSKNNRNVPQNKGWQTAVLMFYLYKYTYAHAYTPPTSTSVEILYVPALSRKQASASSVSVVFALLAGYAYTSRRTRACKHRHLWRLVHAWGELLLKDPRADCWRRRPASEPRRTRAGTERTVLLLPSLTEVHETRVSFSRLLFPFSTTARINGFFFFFFCVCYPKLLLLLRLLLLLLLFQSSVQLSIHRRDL